MKSFRQSYQKKYLKLFYAVILPIAILPIAGLMLGIGSIIESHTNAVDFAKIFKNLSQIIFDNISLIIACSIAFHFTKTNKLYAMLITFFGYLTFYAIQSVFIHVGENNKVIDIFYFHQGEYIQFLVSNNFGIPTLQTSLFFGFIIALIVVKIFNAFDQVAFLTKNLWLTKFSFTPLLLIPIMIILSILVLIIWPFVGQLTTWLARMSYNSSYGFDVFMYGVMTKGLMLFGLDYVFKGIAFQSAIGNELSMTMILEIGEKLNIKNTNEFKKMVQIFFLSSKESEQIIGSNNIWDFINSLELTHMPINDRGQFLPIYEWFNRYANFYVGRFNQDYSTYLGLLVAISGAIILMTNQINRKKTLIIVGFAAFVAFLTGVSQPLELLIILIIPLFYFLIYVPLVGLSLMLMKIFGAHIGSYYANGLVDYLIYGIISFAKGTNFWIVIPITAGQGAFACFSFFLMTRVFRYKIYEITFNYPIYLTKKEYKNLIKVGFTKHQTPSDKESLKKQINNYLLFQINQEIWKKGEKIPSEAALSLKFNCSRLTIRNSLQELVNNGILESMRGKGYYVSNYGNSHFLSSNNQEFDYHHQTIFKIDNEAISFKNKWIDQIEYSFKTLNFQKTHNFEKKYFNKQKKLLIYELSILNKEEVILSDSKQMTQSLIEYLTWQGVVLSSITQTVIFENDEKYRKIAQELGWGKEYPLIISVLASNKDWVEISLKFINRKNFSFSSNYKIIN